MEPISSGVEKEMQEARRRWMTVLAEADSEDLQLFWDRYEPKPEYAVVHGPEIGLLMVQARVGGEGERFYVGEVTVTRCSVSDRDGRLGTAMVLGRRPRHAEIAAVLDAQLQDPKKREHLTAAFVDPLWRRKQEAQRREAGRVAATRVEFVTLVRGE
ncbi:MAG: phosphonate C-P lyase system protein PhnG [Desulfosoma sp.]